MMKAPKSLLHSLFLLTASGLVAYEDCERFYISGSYVLSWFKPGPVDQPLVTTGSTTALFPGALGQPGTRIVFGDDHFHFGTLQGVRVDAGVFIDSDDYYSLDANGFWIFPNHTRSSITSTSDESSVIARPIVNALIGEEESLATAYPGLLSGGTAVIGRSELYGAELDFTYHIYPQCEVSGDVFGGFRFLDLRERLVIDEQLSPLVPGVLTFLGSTVSPPILMQVKDNFKANNQFYGLQLGARFRWDRRHFFVHLYGELGIGATLQNMQIDGSTILNSPSGNQRASGGILALPNANIGHHDRTVFGLVPEVGLKIGYTPFSWLEFFAGYSFLCWNKVLRPGSRINRNVDPGMIPSDHTFGMPGPNQPKFQFHNNVFWAQFFQIGAGFHY